MSNWGGFVEKNMFFQKLVSSGETTCSLIPDLVFQAEFCFARRCGNVISQQPCFPFELDVMTEHLVHLKGKILIQEKKKEGKKTDVIDKKINYWEGGHFCNHEAAGLSHSKWSNELLLSFLFFSFFGYCSANFKKR